MIINLTIAGAGNILTLSDSFAGYAGEHQATQLQIVTQPAWLTPYTRRAEFSLADATRSRLWSDVLPDGTIQLTQALTIRGNNTVQIVWYDSAGNIIAKSSTAIYMIGASINALNEIENPLPEPMGSMLSRISGAESNITALQSDMTQVKTDVATALDAFNGLTQGIPGTVGTLSQLTVPTAYAGLPIDVTANIVASQAGTGGPSPDNVRPIVGVGTVRTARAGKNLIRTVATTTNNGVTFTLQSDGSYLLNGTPSGTGYSYLRVYDNMLYAPKGATLTLSFNNPNVVSGVSLVLRTQTTSVGNFGAASNAASVVNRVITDTTTENLTFFEIRVAVGTTLTNYYIKPQLEYGSVGTSFELYNGIQSTAILPETVYGLPATPNTLNVSNGLLTLRSAYQTFNGTEAWTLSGNTGVGGIGLFVVPLNANAYNPGVSVMSNNMVCNMYTVLQNTGNSLTQMTPNTCVLRGHSSGISTSFYLAASQATADDLKAYLAAQATAGTPLTIVYPLAVPRTLTVPGFTIPALPGLNNIYSDGGGNTDTMLSPFGGLANAVSSLATRVSALEAIVLHP